MIILAIGAHPDDIEIGCGGTISKYVLEGAEVYFLVVTNGEQGSQTVSQKDLAELRKQEAKSSAKVLGAKDVFFMELPDSLTSFTITNKIRLIEKIRAIRPDIIFTHAKQDHFSDHRVVHELSMAAIFSSSGPWFQDADGDPHTVKEVYGYEVWNPLNRWQKVVDISDTYDLKTQALSKHKTQVSDMHYLNAIKGLALYRGALSAQSEYAEAFEVLKV